MRCRYTTRPRITWPRDLGGLQPEPKPACEHDVVMVHVIVDHLQKRFAMLAEKADDFEEGEATAGWYPRFVLKLRDPRLPDALLTVDFLIYQLEKARNVARCVSIVIPHFFFQLIPVNQVGRSLVFLVLLAGAKLPTCEPTLGNPPRVFHLSQQVNLRFFRKWVRCFVFWR
jgi:hypothetical protein